MGEIIERMARAIYMTHWKEPEFGKLGAPTWENASREVREWVRAQARSAYAASIALPFPPADMDQSAEGSVLFP
jgi:hypothetical protein